MAITTVHNELIAVNAISGTAIADNAVTSVHIAQNNVGTVQIALNSVTSVSIALNQVTGTQIANNAITSTQLADNAVTATKVPDGTQFALGATSFTGAITTNSTIDGIDIATRDAILTSTTTTAGAALPKAGGTMTGALTIPSDIIHSGDTDTLLQFNAADSWRVITGDEERLKVNNGEVVVNDNSVDMDFRVESNDSTSMLVVNGGNNNVLVSANNTASVTDAASMVAASVFEINGDASEGSDILRFFAMADGTGNYGMEVSNSGGNAQYDLLLNPINGGNIGIGTTSPASKLHIKTSTNHNLEFEEASGDLRISALNDARDTNEVLQFAASEFNFLTGNVGIGTTSPGAPLQVNGNLLINTTTTDGAEARFQFAPGGAGDAGTLLIKKADASTSGVYLNAGGNSWLNGGNVGIGTDSPGHKLSVRTPSAGGGHIHLGYNGTSANTEAGRISSNSYDVDNSSYSLAEMSFITSSANGYTGGIQFRTNSTNSTNTRAAVRMTIQSDGKVLIGTAEAATVGKAIVMAMVFG